MKPGHQLYNTATQVFSWSELVSDGVSRSCSQIARMKGKWWCTCLLCQCLVYEAFARQEEGWSCRQSMLRGHIKWSEAIQSHKKHGMLFVFPQGSHQHYYYYAAAPRWHMKGRLTNFSIVWMIFYLLNIILFLCKIYLFQCFPLVFTCGSSMEFINT